MHGNSALFVLTALILINQLVCHSRGNGTPYTELTVFSLMFRIEHNYTIFTIFRSATNFTKIAVFRNYENCDFFAILVIFAISITIHSSR